MRYSFYVIVKYEDSLRYQKIFGFVISFIYGNITAKCTFVVSHKFSSSDEENLPKKLVQANLCVVTGQSKCICFRTSLTWRPRQDETLDSPIHRVFVLRNPFGILPGAEVSTEPAVIGADAAEVWKLRGHMCLDRPIDL